MKVPNIPEKSVISSNAKEGRRAAEAQSRQLDA
jgi:hypothetical protein